MWKSEILAVFFPSADKKRIPPRRAGAILFLIGAPHARRRRPQNIVLLIKRKLGLFCCVFSICYFGGGSSNTHFFSSNTHFFSFNTHFF